MILGIGIDQIEIDRVARTWKRFGNRFGRRVYTPSEWDYCLSKPDPASSMAARFAAKEATMKALGRGWPGGIAFRDIEVTRNPNGRPGLRLSHTAAHLAQSSGVGPLHVSLSHDRMYASATVTLERAQ